MLRDRAATLAVLLLLGTSAASAETVLTPFAGVAFSGATERSRGTFGGSLAFLGGVAGLEVEFAITPHFFGDSVTGDLFTKNDVATLMGSFLVAIPGEHVRVYGAFGAGLLKTRLENASGLFDVNSSDFGINAGGGLIVYLNHTVGLRADVRYFRSLQDLHEGGLDFQLGTVDYWRAVGGISFKF
jgi:hypothetical protein